MDEDISLNNILEMICLGPPGLCPTSEEMNAHLINSGWFLGSALGSMLLT